jgi:hypothetical protein
MKNSQDFRTRFFTRNNLKAFISTVVGMFSGFMYYYFIGCRTGNCPLTSSPWLSMLWGAAVGYLVFDLFAKKKQSPGQVEDNRK